MLPLVVTITNSANGENKTVAFPESPVFVGRGPLNDLQLLDPWIARSEGVIEFGDAELSYTRQSSRNHVTIDGAQVTTSGPHHVERELALGQLSLAFSRRKARQDELVTPPGEAEPNAGQRAETVVIDPSALGQFTKTVKPAAKTEMRSVPPPPVVFQSEAPSAPQKPASARELERQTPSATPPVPARQVVDSTRVRAEDVVKLWSVAAVEAPPMPKPAPNAAPEVFIPSAPALPSFPPPSHTSVPPPPLSGDVAILHEHFRASWSALLAALLRRIDAEPESNRARVASELQRSFPQLMREPEFREALAQRDLKPRKVADPELEAWIARVESVLPPGVKLQRGFPTERVYEIIEAFASGFVDLNEAQEEVRRRSLGRPARDSLLRRSDNPLVILAYLLNPEVSWASREAEFSTAIKSMVRHEWALMQATTEGARELLDALAPADVAKREGVPAPVRGAQKERGGFWNALSGGAAGAEAPAARLWHRFVEEYQDLLSGDRYQRTFLGARFAKRYAKAMGGGEGKKT